VLATTSPIASATVGPPGSSSRTAPPSTAVRPLPAAARSRSTSSPGPTTPPCGATPRTATSRSSKARPATRTVRRVNAGTRRDAMRPAPGLRRPVTAAPRNARIGCNSIAFDATFAFRPPVERADVATLAIAAVALWLFVPSRESRAAPSPARRALLLSR
jgi:hypothetical protein